MDICGSHFLLWLRQAVIVGQVPFIGDNKRCATRKGGNNTSCNLFGGRPAVQVLGSMRRLPIFQHGYLFIITFQYFHDECQEPLILHTFFIDSKLNVLMKIVDMIEKTFPIVYVYEQNKCHQQIVPKLFKGLLPQILEFVYEPASKHLA